MAKSAPRIWFSPESVQVPLAEQDLPLTLQSLCRGNHALLEQGGEAHRHLLDEAIEGHPDRLSAKELHDRAWAVVEPHFRAKRSSQRVL
jgi:hypothetical protein